MQKAFYFCNVIVIIFKKDNVVNIYKNCNVNIIFLIGKKRMVNLGVLETNMIKSTSELIVPIMRSLLQLIEGLSYPIDTSVTFFHKALRYPNINIFNKIAM